MSDLPYWIRIFAERFLCFIVAFLFTLSVGYPTTTMIVVVSLVLLAVTGHYVDTTDALSSIALLELEGSGIEVRFILQAQACVLPWLASTSVIALKSFEREKERFDKMF